MGIYARDNLTKYAFQSREPKKVAEGYYDWFSVIEINGEIGEEKELLGCESWEEARQYYLSSMESIDSYNEEYFGGESVLRLRIEGLVYN